jgi:hypothetical protein
VQSPQPARHHPFHLVAFAIAQERCAEGRQDRNPLRAEICIGGEDEHKLASFATSDVKDSNARVHGDYI